MSAKSLVVYVTGISGKFSKDYTGCGKSCLCRQFTYNEYMEESYSTLLQAEFDSNVINQQHTVYWGQKEKSYLLENEVNPVSVNFDVFEHTVLYQDGTSEPFHSNDTYENQIFTPCGNFQDKYAFRSRQDLHNAEGCSNKKFLHSKGASVAYLYVVDVSQACPVFEAQIKLMSRLVKSIQKTNCCVVVASKIDIHCKANLKCLESFANSMNLTVIKCSAKYNTNVDTAFQCLVMEALSLEPSTVKEQNVTRRTTYAYDHKNHVHTKRFSASRDDLQYFSVRSVPSNVLHHNVLSTSLENVSTSDKKAFKRRNRWSSAFSRVFVTKKLAEKSKHYITMPVTYLQNDHNNTLNLPTPKQTASSCPEIYDAFHGVVKSTSTNYKLNTSTEMLYSDFKPVTARPLPPLPHEVTKDSIQLGSQTNPKEDHSSVISSASDLATPRDSVSPISNTLAEPVTHKQTALSCPDIHRLPMMVKSESISYDLDTSPDARPAYSEPGITRSTSFENLSMSDKKLSKITDSLSSAFVKVFVTKKSSVKEESAHNITMPITYLQNGCDSILNLPTHKQTASSCPDIYNALPRSRNTSYDLDVSTESDMLHSDSKPVTAKSRRPLPPLPHELTSGYAQLGIQTSPKQHRRSDMPLPPTPLDLATSRGSVSPISSIPVEPLTLKKAVLSYPNIHSTLPRSKSVSYNIEVSGDVLHSDSKPITTRFKMPLPPLPHELTNGSGNQTSPKQHRRSDMPLPPTPLDLATSRGSVSPISSIPVEPLTLKKAVLSYPNIHSTLPRSKSVSYAIEVSGDVLHSDSKPITTRFKMPLPNGSGNQTSPKQPCRSDMPLPSTLSNLDLTTSRDSVLPLSTTSVEPLDYITDQITNDEASHKPSMGEELLTSMDELTALENKTTASFNQTSPKQCGSSVTLLQSIPLDLAISRDSVSPISNSPNILGEVDKVTGDEVSSKPSTNKELLPSTNELTTLENETTDWNEDEDYVISDDEFFKSLKRRMQEASTNNSKGSVSDGKVSSHPYEDIDVFPCKRKGTEDEMKKECSMQISDRSSLNPYEDIKFSACKEQGGQDEMKEEYSIQASDRLSSNLYVDITFSPCKLQGDQDGMEKYYKSSMQVETDLYESVGVICNCTASKQHETLKLKRLSSNTSNYVYMHSVTCPSLKKDSLVYTYDYIDRKHIEMLKHRKRCSGIPPRNVKRTGYIVDISAYSNTTTAHATYVNCRNIRRKYTVTSLPSRRHHTNGLDEHEMKHVMPPRNIPRPGCYLSAPQAVPAK